MSSKENLQCSICFEDFDIPKLLPCFHSFCQKCLQAHLERSYFAEQQTYSPDGHFSFRCPMCRRYLVLDEFTDWPIEEWATFFPTNYYLSRKTCVKHDGKVINMTCTTSGIDICSVCVIDGHNNCQIFISENAKKDVIETLEKLLNDIIEVAGLWKDEPGCEMKRNQRDENIANEQIWRQSEKFIKLEKSMKNFQKIAQEMQGKITEKISAISSAEKDYILSNDIGTANILKMKIIYTFERLHNHPVISESYCPLFRELDVELNSAELEKIDWKDNKFKDRPKEISYFFLTEQNRTACEKIVSVKILIDASLLILCQTPHKLVNLSWCGEFISELTFSHQPSDMCQLNDGQLAVSFSEQQSINFVKIIGSHLLVTMSFETRFSYQKIASLGPYRLLASSAKKIHVLERHEKFLNISQTYPLKWPLSTLDVVNGFGVLSFVDQKSTFYYNIANNLIDSNFLSIKLHSPIVSSSCCVGIEYFVSSSTHYICRWKSPDKNQDSFSEYILLGIGKPCNIHVNKARYMAVRSTNKNGDRSFIQIFKY